MVGGIWISLQREEKISNADPSDRGRGINRRAARLSYSNVPIRSQNPKFTCPKTESRAGQSRSIHNEYPRHPLQLGGPPPAAHRATSALALPGRRRTERVRLDIMVALFGLCVIRAGHGTCQSVKPWRGR